MKLSKMNIGAAVALALSLGATSAHAIPYADAATIAGGQLAVNPNGLGDHLIFPYYNMREGKRSLFNITNTSNKTLSVKVVVREGTQSEHALDFTLIMSPFDVWTGYLREATAAEAAELTTRLQAGEMSEAEKVLGSNYVFEAGYPIFVRNLSDKTCVIAAFDSDLVVNGQQPQLKYVIEPLLASNDIDIDDLKEGYVTYTAAGAANETGVATGARADGGLEIDALSKVHTAAACTTIANKYYSPTDAELTYWTQNRNTATSLRDFYLPANIVGNSKKLQDAFDKAPGDALKGNFSLIDGDDGLGVGNQALAIANFNQQTEPTDDLVTIHAAPFVHEPTIGSSAGLWDPSGLAEVEAALSSEYIINEWGNNTPTSAHISWVVTAPTRIFHGPRDIGTDFTTARNIWRNYSNVKPAPTAGNPNPKIAAVDLPGKWDIFSGSNVALIGLYAYDREENRLQNLLVPSPAHLLRPFLPHEVNVITFMDGNGDPDGDGLRGAMDSRLGINYDIKEAFRRSGIKASNGWLTMTVQNANRRTNTPPPRGEEYNMDPAESSPFVGFMFKSRKDSTDASKSYNQIVDHTHKSTVPPVAS